MRAFLAALAAWLLSATLASAQMMGISGGPFTVGSAYVGPGDNAPFTAWYSTAYAWNAAYATVGGLAFNARNTITNEQCDFPVVAAGGIGIAKNCTSTSNGLSVSTFCTLGCAVTKLYDQTGGGRHLLQATTGNQPALTVSGIDGLPSLSLTASTMSMAASSSFTPASGVLTIELVADRATGTGNAIFSENGTGNNRVQFSSGVANQFREVGGGSTAITATAADATAHILLGLIAGASPNSLVAVDGTETTGSTTGNTTAGAPAFSGAASTTVNASEWGFIDNTVYSGTFRTALCHNANVRYALGLGC